MKSAFNQTTPTDVLAMYVGSKAVSVLYDKTTKIWPVNQSRIARLEVESVNGTLNGAYLRHALAAISGGATSTKYMLLTAAGYKYHLNKTFNSSTVATWADGVINFPKGTGPTVTELMVGQTVTLQLVIPQRSDTAYEASADVWMKQYDVPWLPGTAMAWSVVSSIAARPTLEVKGGLFSGRVHIHASITGRASSTYTLSAQKGTYVDVANDEYASGDTMLIVTLSPLGSGLTRSGVTPIYPAISRSISLKVKSIQAES